MVLLFSLVAGVVGGAVWAGIAALLRYWRKVPEVITTLLLVFIASQGTGYLLTRTFLLLDDDPNKPNRVQTSAQLDSDTRIGMIRIFGNEFPWSVVVASCCSPSPSRWRSAAARSASASPCSVATRGPHSASACRW